MVGANPARSYALLVAIPEAVRSEAIAAVERFCENRVPGEYRGEVRVDFVVRGDAVTIRELRAPWREEYGPEWSVGALAQMRFDPATRLWTLYWPDRNTRWHVYEDAEPTDDVEWLLREIDLDPSGIFWG